jgi:hypothetical protein
MTSPIRALAIIVISICCSIYSSVIRADVPVYKDTPTRPFAVIGQLKQGECKRSSSETPDQLEKRVISFFSKLAGTGGGFKDANAVVNLSCKQRKNIVSYDEKIQKAIQCGEGIHCEADVVRWR